MLVFRNITERKRLETQLHHQANHDPLTRLANRALFQTELDRHTLYATCSRMKLAIMLIDLDHFKSVNDSFGHEIGDRLLAEVAQRLNAGVRNGDLVARLGGDEFAILATSRSDGDAFASLATRLIDLLGTPFETGTVCLRPAASIGFSVFPGDLASPDRLIQAADRALYAAKAAGRSIWQRYNCAMESNEPGERTSGGRPALSAR
jgi:diguanylate cyclase (GGDEF)-like protein